MFLLLQIILYSVAVLSKEPDLRIVGGHPVSISKRPFQVLLYTTSPRLDTGCGGSIINSRWILTAAHCVVKLKAKNMAIRVGSEKVRGGKGAQWYSVDKSIPHPEFDEEMRSMDNDIALVKTKKNIKFSRNVQPVKLRKKSPRDSMRAVVSGFGKTREDGYMSDVLREVDLMVVGKTRCTELLARVPGDWKLGDTVFCAAYLEGGRDACQGDSGGPITIGNSLAGIVSWGIGCALKYVPAFYTDVSKFIPWISETLKRNSKPLRNCGAGRSNKR